MISTLRSEPAACAGDPPECCTPLDRPALIAQALRDRHPRRCPSCGSDAIAPLFWPDASLDVWDCQRCAAIFSGRGD